MRSRAIARRQTRERRAPFSAVPSVDEHRSALAVSWSSSLPGPPIAGLSASTRGDLLCADSKTTTRTVLSMTSECLRTIAASEW